MPRPWEAEVKKQLDEDVRKGILKPVLIGEATEWCARMEVIELRPAETHHLLTETQRCLQESDSQHSHTV